MKRFIFLLFLVLPMFLSAQVNFNNYFINKSFRFDYLLGGNNKKTEVFPVQMKQEPHWPGSKTKLISPFDYGTYRFRIFDLKSDSLIYSKGFCTLFQEWQTTAEAKQINKTYYQTLIFPFPKKKVRLEIEARQWEGNFKTIYNTSIDPKDYFILKENPTSYKIVDILKNGATENKVDLVILAEGYTAKEMDKFIDDAKRVSNFLFEEEPFKSAKKDFNVRAILTPSVDSGTDIPGGNIYKNTFFNSSFYTFDIERYLTTSDIKKVHDAAALVPYDHIYVLVNSERYGGGGFYNFVSVCTSDNELTKEVFVHEFGHGFAGLGDEYYNSSVAYEDYYNIEVEPWEPNVTTLVNFEKKWKSMIPDSVSIPTPRKASFNKSVGVYEGGGYMSKGIYSPFMDCRMKTNQANGFCPVCEEAIKKVIQSHLE